MLELAPRTTRKGHSWVNGCPYGIINSLQCVQQVRIFFISKDLEGVHVAW